MLTDAQVERYSRQILLPEVGARGQTRLLAARVTLAGRGEAAVAAATLLGRAGVGALDLVRGPLRLPDLSPDCRLESSPTDASSAADVFVALDDGADVGPRALATGRPLVLGWSADTRVTVATLLGRPCAACVARDADRHAAGPAALALGALTAAETLRALLDPPHEGRLIRLDLANGRGGTARLETTAGCAVCAGRG